MCWSVLRRKWIALSGWIAFHRSRIARTCRTSKRLYRKHLDGKMYYLSVSCFLDLFAMDIERFIDIPHKVMEEDTYEGYYIPKGTLIIANIWYAFNFFNNYRSLIQVKSVSPWLSRQMTHDPEIYHDPEIFKPERFLGENGRPIEPDPRTIAFGFGRR